MADARPVRELLTQMRGAGLTQREIAERTGMSPRYQRFVASGQKSGEWYRNAFDAYFQTGRATPAPRRRTKAGEVAHVRGKEGAVTPTERTAPGAATPGVSSRSTSDYAGGRGKVTSVGFPASSGPGRDQGRAAIYAAILSAARSTPPRYVSFTVHTRDGKSYRLGAHGYRARFITSTIRLAPANGDVLVWLVEQGLRERYGVHAPDIIGVDVDAWPPGATSAPRDAA